MFCFFNTILAQCEAGWIRSNVSCKCYHFCTNTKNWNNAQVILIECNVRDVSTLPSWKSHCCDTIHSLPEGQMTEKCLIK